MVVSYIDTLLANLMCSRSGVLLLNCRSETIELPSRRALEYEQGTNFEDYELKIIYCLKKGKLKWKIAENLLK